MSLYPGIHTLPKAYIAGQLGVRGMAAMFKEYIFSVNYYYMMKANLKFLPDIKYHNHLNGEFRRVKGEDIDSLKQRVSALPLRDRRDILSRILFYGNGFTNCHGFFVENKLAYMQWLIYPSENHLIESHYPTRFYPLSPHQVMIENAFTFPEYRGYGLYRYFTWHLLKKARNEGYRCGICYTKTERIIPINEFYMLGFKIDKILSEYRVLFRTNRNLKER
ncbi:MAG: hypothetical protein GF401_19250 [Chitinivibrionales bacterium]|nr:hypothetical protein [Chitinivibrionales bacterium]